MLIFQFVQHFFEYICSDVMLHIFCFMGVGCYLLESPGVCYYNVGYTAAAHLFVSNESNSIFTYQNG